jgi:hypothetical protein
MPTFSRFDARTLAIVALLLAAASLAGPASRDAWAASVASGNGLRLEFSSRGRVTGLVIGQTALPVRGEGGFALADFQNQPEPVNLVPNPGFEAGVAGWHLARGQSLDRQVFHSGAASVRLDVPGPQTASSNLEVIVPVKPNQRYRVGLWMRREGVGVCGAYSSERDDHNRLSGKQTQVGASIPRQDGVWLPLSWEITTEPRTTRLSLRADIYHSTGTLWVDDFFIHEVNQGTYEAAAGETRVADGAVTLDAALPRRGLELLATIRPDRECLRVDGSVRDTTGRDRAIGVKFALPLDLAGWTWHHDAEERETIAAGRSYSLTYRCRTGLGLCSIYPWAAVSGPHAGLSLALPLDQGPRVFLLEHDQAAPETALVFYFGLARDAGRNPSRAPFHFVLYPHDPAWGMRSAMQTYYRLYPQYVPAIEELSRSGWDPVPYARAGQGLIVERYGAFDQGELHFTLRNYAKQPRQTVLALDRKALGIAADAELLALDILPGSAALSALAAEGLPLSIDADGSRAFWIGTRAQAVEHGFRMAVATLEKLQRTFAHDLELDDVGTATWSKALGAARAGTRSSGARALRLAAEIREAAVRLETDLRTAAPVDLAKLLFRLRAQISLVPAALLQWEGTAPRLIVDVLPGATAPVACTMRIVDTRPDELALRVVSPWPEAAGKARCELSRRSLARGLSLGVKAALPIPADPPRRLMPYLLEIHGRANGDLPFTVAMPIDVQVAAPLEVRVAPLGALRGRRQELRVTVRNRLAAGARLTLQLSGPRQAKFVPAALSFDLPAQGTVERSVTLDLDATATIGDLRLSFATSAADPRFVSRGPLFLTVAETPAR